MKKLSMILVVVFTAAILLSSCNRKACPAYRTNVDAEKIENVG